MNTEEQIVSAINGEKVIAKHIYHYHWISGSSTVVYPITLWEKKVVIQIDTKKNVFKKAIERVVNKHPNLFTIGYFDKNDDSCPAEIGFRYTDETMENLKKHI